MLHPQPHDTTQTDTIVELRDVTCGYSGQIALRNVSLRIPRGDFVGLVGPSGAGKTTLLRTILGAVDIYDGEALVDGRKAGQASVGYVPQLEAIDWNFPITVEQVVMLGRAGQGWLPWQSRAARDEAYEVMRRLGIDHLGKRQIRALSGGQQQRTFLGRALFSSPTMLLLDEPTAGVDIKTRDEVLHLLDELNHDGVTIIMTTHEVNAVAAHLPWVVCINGTIIAEGPPGEVYTPEILARTYNAKMTVISHDRMTLVAETPHHIGAHAASRHRTGPRHV
ncbi:MAG TPA: metal ABC transporter ATP-binding protein [Dehalococcoidia bacterium]|nr:metal ABC transporter ATP-binding protein [Dehalococcoidia bacterium]